MYGGQFADIATAYIATLSETERRRLLSLAHSIDYSRAGFAEALKSSGITKIGVRLRVEVLLKEDAGPDHGFDTVPMTAKALWSRRQPCQHEHTQSI